MKKLKKVTISPLKFAKVKQTGEIRAIECQIAYEFEGGFPKYELIDTKKGGIWGAYAIAMQRVKEDMKQRGVL